MCLCVSMCPCVSLCFCVCAAPPRGPRAPPMGEASPANWRWQLSIKRRPAINHPPLPERRRHSLWRMDGASGVGGRDGRERLAGVTHRLGQTRRVGCNLDSTFQLTNPASNRENLCLPDSSKKYQQEWRKQGPINYFHCGKYAYIYCQ